MTTLILAASAPLSAGTFYATPSPVLLFSQFCKKKFFCCTSKEIYCTAHLGAVPDPLEAALRCDVFACCGKERETRRSDALERRKLEFIIFFMFLGCVFGVVKRVEARLILGGAREPSEARPGRSGTLQKTNKKLKKRKKLIKMLLATKCLAQKVVKDTWRWARGSGPTLYNKV
jgi:hypothetical protein